MDFTGKKVYRTGSIECRDSPAHFIPSASAYQLSQARAILGPAHFVECRLLHSPWGFESLFITKMVLGHFTSDQTPFWTVGDSNPRPSD